MFRGHEGDGKNPLIEKKKKTVKKKPETSAGKDPEAVFGFLCFS